MAPVPNLELASPDLLEIASVVMPNADCAGALVARGQFHDVVLLPGVAAVRVARRTAAAAQLPRRLALLDRLCQLNLPFAVPEPLTDAVRVGERVAAAVSWLPGKPLPQGEGHPARLGALLASLANVSLDDVADLLDRPHAYAGGDGWYDLLVSEAIPLLPERLQDTAKRRVDDAAALSPVPPCLVHGDLGGANLHWDADGSLVGVLDWDLAQPFDQAVDVACLGQQGWDNVRAAVGPNTYERARVWSRTFGIEQIVAALTNGEPDDVVNRFVEATVRSLDASEADQ